MVEPTDILDLDEAAQLIPGGPEGMKEMAELLVQESVQKLQEIRDGFENGDAVVVGRGAHTLKSAALEFGAKAVVEAAQKLENMAQAGNLEDAKGQFAELEERAAGLHAALRTVIGTDPA